MQALDPAQVTLFLRRMRDGDAGAADELLPHVYADLRRLAEQVFGGQRGDHTLQPTALVHEAWMRMARPDAGWNDRQHFLRVAALAMRQLLTSYARRKSAAKRSGGERVQLDSVEVPAADTDGGQEEVDLVALSEALEELRSLSERQAEIVELRFFTGLTVPETAEVLGVSERTVFLDWKMARAWLERRLA